MTVRNRSRTVPGLLQSNCDLQWNLMILIALPSYCAVGEALFELLAFSWRIITRIIAVRGFEQND